MMLVRTPNLLAIVPCGSLHRTSLKRLSQTPAQIRREVSSRNGGQDRIFQRNRSTLR
jgi:hypothetical protein